MDFIKDSNPIDTKIPSPDRSGYPTASVGGLKGFSVGELRSEEYERRAGIAS